MSKELELVAAAERHVEGLTAQLGNPNWMPRRAHVEQARNSIAKLAALLRASLPAPEAAPTREEIIEQCAKICNRWIKSKNVHESLAADDIAKAILTLKSVPAK